MCDGDTDSFEIHMSGRMVAYTQTYKSVYSIIYINEIHTVVCDDLFWWWCGISYIKKFMKRIKYVLMKQSGFWPPAHVFCNMSHGSSYLSVGRTSFSSQIQCHRSAGGLDVKVIRTVCVCYVKLAHQRLSITVCLGWSPPLWESGGPWNTTTCWPHFRFAQHGTATLRAKHDDEAW